MLRMSLAAGLNYVHHSRALFSHRGLESIGPSLCEHHRLATGSRQLYIWNIIITNSFVLPTIQFTCNGIIKVFFISLFYCIVFNSDFRFTIAQIKFFIISIQCTVGSTVTTDVLPNTPGIQGILLKNSL